MNRPTYSLFKMIHVHLHPHKIVLLALCFLLASFSHAKDQNQKVPAVWAWKISSEKRTIYLLGELHSFSRLENKIIDYQLGNDIYLLSNEIWTEFDGTIDGEKNPSNPLSTLLSPSTWSRLKKEIRESINKLSAKKGEKTDQFIENFIQKISQSDAYNAYFSIGVLVSTTLNVNNPDFYSQLGFGNNLKKEEKLSFEKKHFQIENSTTATDAWTKHCSSKDKAEALINAALDDLDAAKTEYSNVSSRMQDAFLRSGTTLDDLINVYLETTDGKILHECNITPRNYYWLPKLKQRLETKGDPITFLVGIGHIGGSEGLISLLRKEGYTDIKRIYAVE